ncbi:MAG: adenosylcobinamide-phosphate synthase CbiB [Oscillospiraceae bacterium]|nr:adenosylcobinamide-phosphate synthase CbiB [Oscillospiraceae bacterium]
MLLYSAAAMVVGFIIDALIGDPHSIPHPVCFIGKIITALEKIIRRIFSKNKCGELIGGGLMTVLVLIISTVVPLAVLIFAYRINPWAGFAVEAIMCWQCVAARSLKTESMRVYDALKSGDLKKSRYALSMIVGRDTQPLDESGIIKAAVETVAENTSDGVTAPLIFLIFGGAGGFFYKAVNTMDSMVGYKNDRYIYFGRCSARLDDVLNYIPSRVSAYLMIFAAFLLRMDFKNAVKMHRRDSRKHSSPNSAQTESVMAGALDVELAGNAYYFGKPVEKPTIGDAVRRIEAEDIRRADALMYTVSVLSLILCVCVKLIIWVSL